MTQKTEIRGNDNPTSLNKCFMQRYYRISGLSPPLGSGLERDWGIFDICVGVGVGVDVGIVLNVPQQSLRAYNEGEAH